MAAHKADAEQHTPRIGKGGIDWGHVGDQASVEDALIQLLGALGDLTDDEMTEAGY